MGSLIVESGDRVWNGGIDYHGGLGYAHLERGSAVPDRLEEIIKARA